MELLILSYIHKFDKIIFNSNFHQDCLITGNLWKNEPSNTYKSNYKSDFKVIGVLVHAEYEALRGTVA